MFSDESLEEEEIWGLGDRCLFRMQAGRAEGLASEGLHDERRRGPMVRFETRLSAKEEANGTVLEDKLKTHFAQRLTKILS
jgi:hypothetical protein